jgi:photosystem II stability/assembly factor-like uncharacterized protein
MNIRIKLKLFIVFILFYHSASYSQGSWISIDSPTNQFLKSVDFVDSLYGWAVGNSGTIIHTSDGGNNWVFQDSKTTNEIVDVFFLNRNLGWAVEWNSSSFPFGTILLKTTNGGENWSSATYREDNLFMTCILFLDSLTGWMGGDPHALVKTTDGGISWEQAAIDSSNLAFFPVFSIAFYNNQYGYACGGRQDMAGVTWRTSNGGNKWYPIRAEDAPADPIQEIHTIDSLNVIGISGDIEGFYGIDVIRTSDGGIFWEYEPLIYTGVPTDLDFRNKAEAWSPLGARKKFIYSLDAGVNWAPIPTPDSSAIYDVDFPDSLHGFAVGEQGAILKYNPPIVDDVKVIIQTTPDGYQLYQNYPNPFNPSTIITFTIPSVSTQHTLYVTVKVYDVLGNEIATLINKELSEGKYEVEFSAIGGSVFGGDAYTLPSGVYYYQLRTENFVQTKKMIFLK